MKTLIIPLVAAVSILLTGCSKAAGLRPDVVTEVWLALSPLYPASEQENIRKQVTKFILQAAPGSKIYCYDAWNLRVICSFQVPDLLRDSPANRADRMREQLAELTAWFGNRDGAAAVPELKGTAALNEPEALYQMTADKRSGDMSIVLIGASFLFSPKAPSFSMIQNGVPLIPNDAHLLTNQLGSRFGTAEFTNRLAGTVVRHCYLTEAVWSNSFHMVEVRRFWRGFVGLAGGTLAAFNNDLNSVLASAQKRDTRQVCDFQLDARATKPAMRVAFTPEIPVWMNPPQQVDGDSRQPQQSLALASNLPPLTAVLPQPSAGQTGIGIMWSQEDDIDLYVRPTSGAEELSFRKCVTREGVYNYDYRRANQGLDYEYVELHNPVDLAKVKAWVNFYAGTQAPVQGAVCVHYAGQAYYGTFTLEAPHGNNGADIAQREHSPYWTKLDVLKIVGLAR